MKGIRTVSIVPTAAALVESLRGLGYSTETALADLIDNSISAGAAQIEVDMQWRDGSPIVAVLDDGEGMYESQLAAALCFGGQGPSFARSPSDLGRFGMGLKTASLSQCRRMTVASRRNALNAYLILDIDVIAKAGWVAVDPEVPPEHPMVSRLANQVRGTLVLWDDMDARSGLVGLSREAFFMRVEDVCRHLGMVFNRFISGDARRVTLKVNGRFVKAWDPFQRQHPATKSLGKVPLRMHGKVITIIPWVLPHRDRFANDAEYTTAGGPGGWAARQGFYIYRGNRLLVAGSWLGLGGSRAWTREEASRLARIEVNLPTDLDDEWRIDVRKSQARPPGELRARLTQIAAACRNAAREVFVFRGHRAGVASRSERSHEPVWTARRVQAGTHYSINRRHPVVAGFLAKTGVSSELLDGLLGFIEQSVPVERIWLDVSDTESASPPVLDAGDLEGLAVRLAALGDALPKELSPAKRAELLLGNMNEPPLSLSSRLTALLQGKDE